MFQSANAEDAAEKHLNTDNQISATFSSLTLIPCGCMVASIKKQKKTLKSVRVPSHENKKVGNVKKKKEQEGFELADASPRHVIVDLRAY